MGLIYGNNLHDKLQGLAISKDYLKYNTPFCDLVDDPDWELDINLALNFHSAINGDLQACTKVVQDLTLYSATLDPSTIEFYLHKITYNPIFKSAIKDMRRRWANLDGYDDDFQTSLLNALKDCLNSPCNLFNETSDSIGRMAQSASTKTSDNTFGVGSLEGSFTNMIDGLDQTILNKIPSIFSNAFTEVTQVANKAFENTQAVLTGKKNLKDLTTKVQQGKSFRDPAKMFRYTPDVKSYYDYSAAGSNVLSKIKEEFGGCFNRFEFKYRYNPYENNMSRPIGERVNHVNGEDYDTNSTGTAKRFSNNKLKMARATATGIEPVDSANYSKLPAEYSRPDTRKTTDGVNLSDTYILHAKNDTDFPNRPDYSVFGALLDVDDKILYFENYAKTPNDLNTLQGVTNRTGYDIAPSSFGYDKSFMVSALNGEEVRKEGKDRLTLPGAYALNYNHDISDEGMITSHNTAAGDLTFNDGVAVSIGFYEDFMFKTKNITFKRDKDGNRKAANNSYVGPQRRDEFFVAIRPVGAGEWAYYQVCDSNQQPGFNVDFTVGALKHFLTKFGKGDLAGKSKAVPIEGTEWKRKLMIRHNDVGPLEAVLCQGSIDTIKAELS